MTIRPNPAFVGPPRRLEILCHDRSPFITVVCECGHEMHLHETQLAGAPEGVVVGSFCNGCDGPIEIALSDLRGAFDLMREEGWV